MRHAKIEITPAPIRERFCVKRSISPSLAGVSLTWALAVSGCSEQAGPHSEGGSWHVLAEDQPGALFSVTGTAEDDVWVVGADRGDGAGPTLLHFDGERWELHATGVEFADLVWVHAFEAGPVYAGGTAGLMLRYDGASFERLTTPSEQDIWGIWGATPDDLWVVGGDPNIGAGFIWRDRGQGLEPVALPEELPSPSAWYKVWGTERADVWFCGVDGALLHYDGSEFSEVAADTSRPLLTIHGRSDGSLITAVGGQYSATLVASKDGAAWRDVTPREATLQMFGVYHRNQAAYAVGMQTSVLHHDGSKWVEEPTELDLAEDFHSVWIDPALGVWATGGQIVSPPFTRGALIYRGSEPPRSIDF